MTLELSARLASRGFSLDLRIEQGETIAVLGPNGAGKSTLLSVIAGLLVPDAGRATLNDRVLFEVDDTRRRSMPPHERGVAMLAQDALLFPHLSARENVAFGPRSRGASRGEAHRLADEWLARVDATALAHRRPAELSGGQAQRVAIARALAVDPSLLLLDEPMAALDVSVVPSLRRLLRAVLRDRMAVIVTHNVLDAVMLADRVVLVESGRIVASGPTREVLERPGSAFAAGLVGLNLLRGTLEADGSVRTDDGHAVAATLAAGIEPGDRVGVAVRPSRVEVAAGSEPVPASPSSPASPASPANGSRTELVAKVTDIEPRGDGIRVRASGTHVTIAADVPPSVVADLDLVPGSVARFSFAAVDAAAYPLEAD